MDWPEIYRRLQRDRNDPLAWDGLEQRVRPWARSALWSRGWHLVDDAVADTCSTVAVSLEKARGAETFAGFVLGHFFNVRNKILASPQSTDLGDDHDELPAPPIDEPTSDERALLQHCLEQLPLRERRAVELRYFEEAAAARIAALLDVTEGNARRIVFNGLAHLRQCVERHWPKGRE